MTTSATFRVATGEDMFMATVGISWGHLADPAGEIHEVWTLELARLLLQKLVSDGSLIGEEAGILLCDMREAGMLETSAAVFETVRAFRIPEQFVPGHRFARCMECRTPLVHGYVYEDDNVRASNPVTTLFQGFEMCRAAVRTGTHVLDAVTVFQHMLEAALAPDDAAIQARFGALPEDVRRPQPPQGFSISEIRGGGMLIEFSNAEDLFELLFGQRRR